MADLYQMMQDSQKAGMEGYARGQQTRLAQMMSQAMQGPNEGRQAAVAQMAAIDPQSALTADAHFNQMDDVGRKRLGEHAAMFDALPEDQKAAAYPQLAAEAQALGVPNVPGQWNPQFAQGIRMLAQAYGGISGKGPEDFTLSPGSKRFNASGQMIAEVPFAPANGQFVTVPDGQGGTQMMFGDPRTGGLSPLGGGAPQPSFGGGNVQDVIKGLAGQFGGQVSSLTRTPEHNREVGGVPNSQHVRGTAGDVVLNDPRQRAAYMQAARAAGLEVIDEGDHVHAELPPGARSGGGLGYTPPKSDTKAPSALMEKLQLAQAMGATPEQMRQMVMGDTGGGKPSATMLRQANAAKQKLIDLNAIEHQLSLVDNAFAPLKDTFSATPYVGKFLPTEDGKRFDASVSLLQGMVRKLTRTPGEGAMSDYETKLAQLANPSRSEYESVTADQLSQLRSLVQTMRQGYEAILQDNGGNSDNIRPQGSQPEQAPTSQFAGFKVLD